MSAGRPALSSCPSPSSSTPPTASSPPPAKSPPLLAAVRVETSLNVPPGTSRQEQIDWIDTPSSSDKSLHLINKVLPIEMLEKVFSHLDPKDLKTVMLVCKSWKSTASAPALWSWATLTWPQEHEHLSLKSFLKTIGLNRLQGARHIKLEGDIPRKSSSH